MNRFLALPPPERRLLAEAFLCLPVLAFVLRLLGLGRCCVLLRRVAPGAASGAAPAVVLGRARRAAALVRSAAAHGPFHSRCLTQALTLWVLLRRRGIASDLRIGVRKRDGALEAHAWVEHRGAALSESEHPGRPVNVSAAFARFDGCGVLEHYQAWQR